MYDVAIIGAGPAGSTLARMLAGRCRVLLVDRRTLDAPAEELPFRKCCGGLLAPDAQAMLSRMGLGLPREILVGPQLFVVRTLDIPAGLERYYQRHYINIDREKFDRWMASLVPGDVEKRFGRLLRGCEAEGEGVRLQLAGRGGTEEVRARVIVGADGAASKVRKILVPGGETPRAYMAIQQWFEAKTAQPYFSVFFDPALTEFYCWTIPKEDRIIVGGAFFPRRGAAERFERLRERLVGLGYDLGRSVRKEGALLLRPLSAGQISVGRGCAALVGEAAGWISPSSAEGLSYAMRSAAALAEALKDGTRGFLDRYRAATAGLRLNITIKNLKSTFIFGPRLRMLVMRSGITSEKIL